jgi:aspartyl-tRNA(Asn)/glutamyl-tRNA(Gln) amidotransferase subunit C
LARLPALRALRAGDTVRAFNGSLFKDRSMSLDKQTVARIARLARLKVPEEDLQGLAGELSGIMSWIEQLNSVDTSAVEPMTSVADLTLPLREDKVTDGRQAARVLANAPGGAVLLEAGNPDGGGFFVVPKVVE